MYYLQSRYYDPKLGRFISPDSVDYLEPNSVIGLNLYAYCLDNPIMFSDSTGTSIWSDIGNWLKGAGQAVGNFFTQTIPDFFVNTVYEQGIKPAGQWIADTATDAWNWVTDMAAPAVSNFFTQTITSTAMSFGRNIGGIGIQVGNFLTASVRSGKEKFQHVMRIVAIIGEGIAMAASIVTLIFPAAAPVTSWIIAIGAIVAVICGSLGGMKVELN